MRKYLLSSVLVAWSAQLFAGTVTTVRLNPDIGYAVNGTTNITFTLGSTAPSGDATSDSAPAKVYVPMDGPAETAFPSEPYDEAKYFSEPGVTTLYTAADAVHTVNFPLYLNATATNFYLYAAIKDNTGATYKVAKQFSNTPFNGTTNLNQEFPVTIAAFCAQLTDCTNFATVSGTEKTYLTYFFFSTTSGLAIGSVIDPTVATGGIFFQLNMSNRVYPAASITPSISEVRSGDKRIIIAYSSNANILQPKSVRVFNYGATNPGGAQALKPIQFSYAVSGGLSTIEFPYAATGEATINNLENGITNYVSVVFLDNYKFASVVSADQLGTPKEIQELLKKNSCFLLTAGFGEDHYVISYFRHFRDAVLMNSYLGRKFVHVYYELAPKYALIIYQHEGIRAAIRGAAYSLYFIFNYIYVLFFAAILICAFVYSRRWSKVTKVN